MKKKTKQRRKRKRGGKRKYIYIYITARPRKFSAAIVPPDSCLALPKNASLPKHVNFTVLSEPLVCEIYEM